jgi:hypothetical protein
MRPKVFFIIVITSVLVIACGGQQNETLKVANLKDIEGTVADHDFELSGSAREIAIQLVRNMQVPGGIVEHSGCAADHKQYLRIARKTTLVAVLRSLNAAAPEYDWRLENGAVVILPRDKVVDLMSTRIRHLEFDSSLGPSSAVTSLAASPEVLEAMHNIGLQPGLIQGGPGGSCARDCSSSLEKKKEIVVITNQSFRDALSYIAKTFGNIIWTYDQRKCGNRGNVSVGAFRVF